jgi:cellulose synthase/poly-beta-1,6-N-acetylglucosamine synthase-like glycosyltransferase
LTNILISEKRWILLFIIIVAIWSTILYSTIFHWSYGLEILVDKDVDLFYITIPLIGFNLLYNLITIFIYVFYLLTYDKIEKYQKQKILMFTPNIKIKGCSNKIHNIDIKDKNSFTKNKNDQNIICSIIIPSKNEEKVIRKTVENCLLQTYPYIEVIVICHNCTDKTFEEAKLANDDDRLKVFDFRTRESGKGIALNYGLEKSNGKYILVLDGDGKLSREFIEKAIPLLEDSDIAGIQGKYISSNRNYNFITKLLSIEGDLWSTPYMTVRSLIQKRTYLGGTGFIIKKDILIRVGKFKNHLVDDYELSCRLFKKNYKILFAPLSIDYDEKPPHLSIMLRQRARWARGFLSLLKTNAVDPTDILGYIYWLNPVALISGIMLLLIYGYAILHNLLFEYYPYSYAYIPLNYWFLLIGTTFAFQLAVLVKEHGYSALKEAIHLLIYYPFSLYVFIAFIKGIFVKSWANTKTVHGFVKEFHKVNQ